MPMTQPDSAPQAPDQMPASTWNIQAPYSGGTPSKIYTGGSNTDQGSQDDIAATVAAAKAAAMARESANEADTHPQGSQIGDPMTLPRNPGGFSLTTEHIPSGG